MPVTLEELFNHVRDQEITLLAGEKGLNNIVRWVHMVENLEISDFLEGNEIAFTTGIGLEKQEDLIYLVEGIIHNRASGVVVNIGPFISEISPEIIELCNQNNFPLFMVPWNVHMARIMRSFCYSIVQADKLKMELSGAVKNAIFHHQTEDLYIQTFAHYQFDFDWSYCVAIMEMPPSMEHSELLSELSRTAEETLVRGNDKAITFLQDNTFVLVFARYTEIGVKQVVRKIYNHILEKLKSKEIYLGIGQSTNNIRNLYKSYHQAKQVAHMHWKAGQTGRISNFREIGLYKVLLAIDDKNIGKEYYKETIGKLIEYDRLNHTDYLDVLKAYLESNGSLNKTADKLFVHRNTINYKIRKIEHILDCDLSDLNVRVDIVLAFRIIDVL